MFNKAATMNAGFKEAVSRGWEFDCVILHDIDLLMEDDRNILKCGENVRHYGVYIDKFQYEWVEIALANQVVHKYFIATINVPPAL